MPDAPKVRTHSIREVWSMVLGQMLGFHCRGCGTNWPLDADREALERQPCGTPERSEQ